MEPVMVHERITYTFEEVLQTESDIKYGRDRCGDQEAYAISVINTLIDRFKRSLNAPAGALCEYEIKWSDCVPTVVIDVYWLERGKPC